MLNLDFTTLISLAALDALKGNVLCKMANEVIEMHPILGEDDEDYAFFAETR